MNYLWQTSSAYLTANLVNLVSNTVTTTASGATAAQTNYGYDENNGSPQGALGNLTSITHTNNVGASPKTQTVYNTQGMPTLLTDANSNMTSISSYQCSGAFPQKIIRPYQSSTTLAETTSYVYDCNTGLMTSMIDPNSRTTSYTYSDPLNRLTLTQYPDGGSLQYHYNDTASPVNVTTSQPITSSITRQIEYDVDGLGRLIHTRLLSDPTGADITDTNYDKVGRILSVSNPYRSTSDVTYGVTTYAYDALGRKAIQTRPDSSTLQWCYNGIASAGQTNCLSNNGSQTTHKWTDYSDETGRHWQQVSDGLDRLSAVTEPNSSNVPGLETDYSYDVLGNLLRVDQWGGPVNSSGDRIRTFNYDSLSRLNCSSNPENSSVQCPTTASSTHTAGTLGYVYDANGNVTSKTDARQISVGYTYDALDRMITKSASDGSFNYGYTYDVATISGGFSSSNPIGRLVEASNGVNASSQYSYDPMGRVVTEANCIPSNCTETGNSFQAQYYLAGNLESLTYPDGRVISQAWDGAGHLSQVANGSLSGYSYLTTLSGYWPNGAPEGIYRGNGVVDGIRLNNRLQPDGIVSVRLGTTFGPGSGPGSYSPNVMLAGKTYCYGPAATTTQTAGAACPSFSSADNGSILQIVDRLNNNNSQTFSYDTLNRIASFTNGSGTTQQSYTIDPWGNMTESGTATTSLVFSGESKNQDASGDLGYDASGNTTSVYNGISRTAFTYDADGKTLTANSGSSTYTYDANGNRVRKDAGGTWTEYVYFNGQPLAEKSADGTWSDYLFANGQRIARADNYDIRIHLSGTNCSNCGTNPNMFAGVTSLTAANGYTIQSGDILTWRQYQDGVTVGGIFFGVDNSSGTFVSGNSLVDTDGQPIDADTTKNTWHVRTVDLSSFAGMKVASIDPFQWTSAPPGSWDIYYGDIILVSANGSYIPIYSRSMMTLSVGTNPTVSNFSAVTEKVADTTPLTTTTYYHRDQIGSSSTLTAGTGWPVSTYIYFPYGQGPQPGTNHYLFTGKERDQESGNDYFGARYYASTMGRWMSPDPSNLGVDIYMPQTWNRYNYAVNNPLTIKDANGLWPFYIHNEIINESFPGMSKQDLQGLKSASWNMDFGKGQQDPSMSYEHGMSDGTTNQDPMVAQQMGDDFISQQVQTAQQAQADWEAQGHTGIAPAALTAFGNALHTATDRTSPSHRGNQPWKNEPWYKKSTRDHVAGEATINANDRRAAQNAAQQLFHRTFGDEFDWMLQKQPCAQTSATDSQGNTTGWSPCQ
jgi:RHS repeat-associated protein